MLPHLINQSDQLLARLLLLSWFCAADSNSRLAEAVLSENSAEGIEGSSSGSMRSLSDSLGRSTKLRLPGAVFTRPGYRVKRMATAVACMASPEWL